MFIMQLRERPKAKPPTAVMLLLVSSRYWSWISAANIVAMLARGRTNDPTNKPLQTDGPSQSSLTSSKPQKLGNAAGPVVPDVGAPNPQLLQRLVQHIFPRLRVLRHALPDAHDCSSERPAASWAEGLRALGGVTAVDYDLFSLERILTRARARRGERERAISLAGIRHLVSR